MFKCATPARLPFGRAYKAPQSFLARTKKANKKIKSLLKKVGYKDYNTNKKQKTINKKLI